MKQNFFKPRGSEACTDVPNSACTKVETSFFYKDELVGKDGGLTGKRALKAVLCDAENKYKK